jgi:8-oxo-(d)GTP phosphatase
VPDHPDPQQPDIVSAGVVVTRKGGEVLLVHRPRYDDWSFPKGKLEPGESTPVAAVREAAEETGLRVRLGPPLAAQEYPVGTKSKVVHYWAARVVGHDDVSSYRPNEEIDDVRWCPRENAADLLSYSRDRETLADSGRYPKATRALVVVRHARAEARDDWPHEDRQRPLRGSGVKQAHGLVPLLAAYDVAEVVTSDSTRCVQTVTPYAEHARWPIAERPSLSEEGATKRRVAGVVADLLETPLSSALCTHRPVLPMVFSALGLVAEPLDPAEALVVHHRKGKVVAIERHAVVPGVPKVVG